MCRHSVEVISGLGPTAGKVEIPDIPLLLFIHDVCLPTISEHVTTDFLIE